MDPARFGELVRTLEQRSHRSPRLYRVQVGAIAALGYLYVALLLLAVIGFIVGLVWFAVSVGGGGLLANLLLPALALAWVLLRALWIRVPDAAGIPLQTERIPRLAATIEKVRARVDAPRFRRVLLDGDFNAAVAQRPRFGLIGPSVSDLILGLPLMQALSPREFEAVLAHEMGHVSRRHGRFGHWIYRIRVTWSRLAEAAGAGGGSGVAGLLLGRFLDWYAPFFGAYSFVLARQDEYEADASAVEVAGREAVAAALVRIEVVGRFHAERHWAAISHGIAQGGDTPAPFSGFVTTLATALDCTEAESWLAQSLRRPTDYDDTHPCLADRLRAIRSGPPTVPPPPAESAATVLLGRETAALANELDARWREHAEPRIAQARADREAALHRLQELTGATSGDPDSAWDRVKLLHTLDRDAEATAAAEALLASHPAHVSALFFVGSLRLKAEDASGIALLERAAALHPPVGPAAQQRIFDFHWRHGRRDQAEAARAALARIGERLEAAARERASLAERLVLVPHDLSAREVERIRTALGAIPGLREAYVARRIVVELPELPCYIVGVVPDRRWWRFRNSDESERVRDEVMAAAPWPESTYFVLSDAGHTRLVRRIRKQAGAWLAGRRGTPTASSTPADPAMLERLRLALARRRIRRRRVRLTFAATASVVALLVGTVFYLWQQDIKRTPLRVVTVADAAEQVRASRGRPTVLVLYDPREEHGVLVGQLRAWAPRQGEGKVEVLAFTTGDRFDAQRFFRYTVVELGLPRLAPLWIEPWRRGTLDSTMATLGVRVGARWTAPLVAVIDADGKVVAQWQGHTDPDRVLAAVAGASPGGARTAQR